MWVHRMPGDHVPVDRPRVVDRRLLRDFAGAGADSEARVVWKDELPQIATQGGVIRDRVRLRAIAQMTRDMMEDERQLVVADEPRHRRFQNIDALVRIKRTELAPKHG